MNVCVCADWGNVKNPVLPKLLASYLLAWHAAPDWPLRQFIVCKSRFEKKKNAPQLVSENGTRQSAIERAAHHTSTTTRAAKFAPRIRKFRKPLRKFRVTCVWVILHFINNILLFLVYVTVYCAVNWVHDTRKLTKGHRDAYNVSF